MTTTLQPPPAAPADPARPAVKRRRRRRWLDRMVPLACLLLAALVMLYPVVATYYNNYRQTEFAQKYDAQVGDTSASTLQQALNAAHRYNDQLAPALLTDPYTAGTTESTPAYRAYLKQLNLFDAMARLRISRIGVDLPIYHGTSEDTLSRGVGHFFGSSLPVGGRGTHSVLTAHSSMANASLFDNLHELVIGDTFVVSAYGRTLAYRVDKIDIVLPDEVEKVARVDGADYVTLVTCTPYAVNSHRLLVRGTRIPYNDATMGPSASVAAMDWTPQPWMYPRLLGSAAALLSAAGMTTKWILSDRRRARARARARRQDAQQIDSRPDNAPGGDDGQPDNA